MPTGSISYISKVKPQTDELSRLFASGAKAVIVEDNDRTRIVVEAVLNWLGVNERYSPNFFSPFGNNLLDLARNHIAGNQNLGDVLRFEPGRMVYAARKFIVYGSTVDQSLLTFPDRFYTGNQYASVPNVIKELTWSLMLEVFASLLPGAVDFYRFYAIKIEILNYPGSLSDIKVLGNTLADSCGRWSRWGNLIDTYRNNAYGIFDVKIVRDLYAICSLLPGIGGLLGVINTRMALSQTESVPNYSYLLGRSHVDDRKYVTVLAGCRDNLHTQIFDGAAWIPLKVAPNTVAIFPSPELTHSSGIPATHHRILLSSTPGNETGAMRNISLSLSIINRPNWL